MRTMIVLVASFFCIPLFIGCGGESGTMVLNGEVKKDPSLDDSYYDQAEYDRINNNTKAN